LTFLYNNNSFKQVVLKIHELPLNMAIALMALAFGSIFLGYIAKDLFVGFGTDF
jgi:NADH-ubiquinone oxidoreductase chain 5